MRKFAVFVPVLALSMLVASSSSVLAQQSLSITIGPGRDDASGTGLAAAGAWLAGAGLAIRRWRRR
jgi:hypothetical protein